MDATPAHRGEMKTRPMGPSRRAIPYRRGFSRAEWARARCGVSPAAMEDRWFIFLEGDRLWMHRSWTGLCVFEVRVEPFEDSFGAVEAWYDPESMNTDDAGAARMLAEVVTHVLLAPPPEFRADWVVTSRPSDG